MTKNRKLAIVNIVVNKKKIPSAIADKTVYVTIITYY